MPQTVTVNYTTGDGTAVAGTDYQAVSGTLTFTPGQVAQTVDVPVYQRLVAAQSVTLGLAVSDPTGGVAVAVPTGIGTIVDPGTIATGAATPTGYAYTDNLGQPVKITVRGGGTAQVVYLGNSTAVSANAPSLILSGTTARTTVSVSVPRTRPDDLPDDPGRRKPRGVRRPVGQRHRGVHQPPDRSGRSRWRTCPTPPVTIGGTAGSVAFNFLRVVDSTVTSAIPIRSITAGAYINTTGGVYAVTAPTVGPRPRQGDVRRHDRPDVGSGVEGPCVPLIPIVRLPARPAPASTRC